MKKLFLLIGLTSLLLTSQAQDFEGTKKLNGTSLYLKIYGKGEPLVVIHGGPGLNQTYLEPFLKKLSSKYRLVFYDQRASGNSATPSLDSISLDFFAGDLEAIRKELGVAKLNIFTHSWGAVPASVYGMRFPDKINKLILCNPVALSHEFDQVTLDNQRKKASRADSIDRSIIIGSRGFRAGEADAYRKLMILSFRHSFYNQDNYSKLQLELPFNFRSASQALQKGLGKEAESLDLYESLKVFSFPVLILHGIGDAIPLSASTRLQSKIPKSSLEVFSKSGHFIFIEQQGKFVAAVQKFLSTNNSSAASGSN